MNALQLLNMAMANAKSESLNQWPNQVVYLLFNGESEYTVVCEKNLHMVMDVEPNLTIVAKFLNGEKVNN